MMNTHRICFIASLLAVVLLLIGFPKESTAQEKEQKTVETIERWLQQGQTYFLKHDDIPGLIRFYAEKQLNTPYIGGLLDQNKKEQLVITLEGSDCVIYVETSIALTATTLQGRSSYQAFTENLKAFRYREREVEGYYSRLHYFSDWLRENQEKGMVEIMFQEEELPEIGPVHFMSNHRSSYPMMATNDSLWNLIKQKEKTLSREGLHYIPVEKISEYENRFKTGDILGFVTSVDGLDITHTSLVRKLEGPDHFYHASLDKGFVTLSQKSIETYAKESSSVIGIIIARLKSAP